MPTELQHRRLQAEDAAIPITAGDRTAEVIFTTGAAVTRRDWMTGERYVEVLSLEPGHVRMERLERGAPLLAVHNQFELDAVIGVTESASVAKGKGTARVRFAKTPEGDKALALVRDRILRNVSVGYIVHRYQKTEPDAAGGLPTWLAIDWEPAEISIVPVPADPGAQVRGAPLETALDSPPNQRKEMTMPQAVNPAASGPAGRESDEQYLARVMNLTKGSERRAEILERTMRAGLDHTYAQRMIDSQLPLESVCARIVDEIARRHAAPPINAVRTGDLGADPQAARDAMAEAIVARYSGTRPAAMAHPYMGRRIVDHARELIEMNGIRTTGMAPQEIIQRGMMSTSDFPGLLEDVANKFLRRGYAAYTGGVRVIARRGPDAPDFKALKKLALGEAPTLSKVLEGGEVKRGAMAEMKETYSVESFAKIIPLSLQALVNDDLNAFTQLSQKWGRAAAEFECTQLATLLTSNPTMGSDSTALFHANHGNLAGSGGAISVTTLGAAKLAMRKQKDIGGVSAIDVTPRYLVVPAALEVVALQYVTQITPAQSSNVNPFTGLEVVVDPRLDANSATAWFLAAGADTIDTLEYSYLEGTNGLQLETQRGWDTLGMEMRAVLHYGCGVLDYRGLYKNPGA